MKTKSLPKVIYARLDRDGNEFYLMASDSIEDFGNGDKVGVYNLYEVDTVAVTVKLKGRALR